jgi:fructose-1-phosphate kinase PfkB-like protein
MQEKINAIVVLNGAIPKQAQKKVFNPSISDLNQLINSKNLLFLITI